MTGYTAANRAVFIVDKEGVVRYRWLADSPANEPNYEEVRQALSGLA
jgi:peroxiredoxin